MLHKLLLSIRALFLDGFAGKAKAFHAQMLFNEQDHVHSNYKDAFVSTLETKGERKGDGKREQENERGRELVTCRQLPS